MNRPVLANWVVSENGRRTMNDTVRCKHCEEWIDETGIHQGGYQRGKHTCAVDPYGFSGHPKGTDCEYPCIGVSREVDR